MNTCKNCESTFEGNYCNTCGQKLITKRFTLKESILWIFTSIFNYDKGFLYTTKELFIRPGEVINSFLKGNTIRFAHPFRFLFVWATLSAVLGVYLNIYEESGMAINSFSGQSEQQIERSRRIFQSINEYMSFIMMGTIPFLALGTYLVSKKKGLNYAEHLIMVAFGNASSIVIGLPILLIFMFIDDTSMLTTISMVLGTLIMGRVLAKTLGDKLVVGILRYILSFIIGIAIMMICLIAVMLIYALIMKSFGLSTPFSQPQ